jgi:hypothetical protein
MAPEEADFRWQHSLGFFAFRPSSCSCIIPWTTGSTSAVANKGWHVRAGSALMGAGNRRRSRIQPCAELPTATPSYHCDGDIPRIYLHSNDFIRSDLFLHKTSSNVSNPWQVLPTEERRVRC